MRNQPPSRDIEHPILSDARSGIDCRFNREIVPKRAVGYLHYESEIFRLRIRIESRKLPFNTMRSGFRLIPRIVRGAYIDRGFGIHKISAERIQKPERTPRASSACAAEPA